MREPIEMNQIGAVLGEGAAVRLNGAAMQSAGGETHVYFEPCDEYARGFRAVTVPAHDGCGCRDMPVTGVRFVLPEDLRVDGGRGRRGRRHFILRTSNHYVDGVATF